jgi:hypothetical protein
MDMCDKRPIFRQHLPTFYMKEIIYMQIGLCFIFSNTKMSGLENEQDKLTGIRFYHEFFYMPIESDGKLNKGENRDDFYNSSHKILFDSAGNILEDLWYSMDLIKRRTTYGYDGSGNLIFEKSFVDNNLFRTTEYKWDKNGNKIEERTFHADDKQNTNTVFLNDKQGNCIESTWYKYDGTLISKEKLTYDENKNRIEKRNYKSSGEQERFYIFKYDNSGNKIEERNHDAQGQLIYRHVYKYDKKGRKIDELGFLEPNQVLDYSTTIFYDIHGNISKEINSGNRNYQMEFRYEYDRRNNWIRKIEYRNNEPELILERTIEYF